MCAEFDLSELRVHAFKCVVLSGILYGIFGAVWLVVAGISILVFDVIYEGFDYGLYRGRNGYEDCGY